MTFSPFSIISIVLFSDFISLPRSQHPERYLRACCYLAGQHHHSYQDQPVLHLAHRSVHTFQHLQPGKQY